MFFHASVTECLSVCVHFWILLFALCTSVCLLIVFLIWCLIFLILSLLFMEKFPGYQRNVMSVLKMIAVNLLEIMETCCFMLGNLIKINVFLALPLITSHYG